MSKIDLYQDDCLKIMGKLIEDGVKVDAIITDPPYKTISGGVSIKNGKIVSDGTKCSNKWLKKDATSIPATLKNGTQFRHNNIKFKDWLLHTYKILKEGGHIYIMTNDRNIQNLLNESVKAGFKLLNILIWKKNNATPNKWYMKNAEFIVLLRKGKAIPINNMGTKTVLEVNNIIGNKMHPSEKPMELLKILIENSTNKNDIVLDPFMGSGTTGAVCKDLNRDFIGIELDKKYFEIAKERIEK